MARSPLLVLADDLTGAAEIAAIAHHAGLRAVVLTTPPAHGLPLGADVVVFDTDTRLDEPAVAAHRVATFTNRLRDLPHAGLFKKTDSVLRGPVLAEVTACAQALGRPRVLLVPCNPSLGRVIRGGRYYIGGQPINRTPFARDPHHPRRSADVRKLLGADKSSPITCAAPTERLPREGVIIGEADTPGHVAVWVGRIDPHTLPAGGADFFRIWLQSQREYQTHDEIYQLPAGPVLLINGTTSTPPPISPLPVELVKVTAKQPPTVEAAFAELSPRLAAGGFAAVTSHGPVVREPGVPAQLGRIFAGIAREAHAASAFRHLLVAGGATAAVVLHELGWTDFEIMHVWGPGVVTLRPQAAANFVVTMKPGSYPWPASLGRALNPALAAGLQAGPATRYAYSG